MISRFYCLVLGVSHRRNSVETLIDVLSIARADARITHLMYKANLSYSTLRRYVSSALEKGLMIRVCNDDGSVVYRTTEKGRALLEKLRDVEGFWRF